MSIKVPLSERLKLCASLVPDGARVADIGCDHGYLGIYLLLNGAASHVYACDLRQKPLCAAMENAKFFHTTEKMDFICTDGLTGIKSDMVDTIVCAGMGGDLIHMILAACPWIMDKKYTLILQPQSGAAELRGWLSGQGFAIDCEIPIMDNGFMYCASKLHWSGRTVHLTPGQMYLTPQLLASGSAVLPQYIERQRASLERIVSNLERAAEPTDRLEFFRTALDEILETEAQYGSNS